jgi:signal transduction histidine kinase
MQQYLYAPLREVPLNFAIMENLQTLNHPQNQHNLIPIVRTLLIDDDEDDFILIRDILLEVEKSHFKVDWVPDYAQAIKALQKDEHDVCLLDYRLGMYDGLDILKQADIGKIFMPVIFLTGQGDYEVDTMAMRAGVDDYLSKDEISSSLLERAIRYSIERKKNRTALNRAYGEMEQAVLERTAELAQANEKIKESSDKIKRFAFSVSHDLKNPAIGIFGLTKRLFNDYSGNLDVKGKNICTQILHAAEQIAFLVENINLYITTKEMPIRYEPLKLNDICRIIREEFSAHISARGIEWSQPNSDLTIKADKLSLLRALRNLVDNSFKYGGDSLSRISIIYRDTEEYHVISVADNGIGLLDDDSEKIFGLFFRGKTLKKIEGTGMGLAIVKEIAEQHGGDVWAESVHNKGMTISMSFSKLL